VPPKWLAGRVGTAVRRTVLDGKLPSFVSRCPECGQAQRHPDTAGRVSCPCGVIYDWPSGRPVLELIAVAFVCAKTDKPFTILQERINRHQPFRHRMIELDTEAILRKRLASVVPGAFSVNVAQEKSLSPDDFDSDGCVCPHCQPTGNTVGWSYISCHSCGAYVCSGSVVVRDDGRATFKCRPSCGSKGELEQASDRLVVTELNVARFSSISHKGLMRYNSPVIQ